MIRRQEGFTLVELLITMVIFVLTMAAATSIFAPLLTQFKQQSKMTETQMEGIVGLETLRRDIEQAGYGLPWNVPSNMTYAEAQGSPASTYNDTPGDPACRYCPRAILSGRDAVTNPTIGTSDYLVIKSTIVGVTPAAPKWTYMIGTGAGKGFVKCWKDITCDSPDDFKATDRVIALIPSEGGSEINQRILASKGIPFSNVVSIASEGKKYLLYGVDQNTDLRMPFNRADYYIATTGLAVPPRCAPGTGLLVKSVISQVDGKSDITRGDVMPLMDCVAGMKIIYGLDVKNDGTITYTDDISAIGTYSVQAIRDQVREVRVYVLSHEGQRDQNYNAATQYPAGTVTLGEFGIGRSFPLSAITDWQKYRWKVYTMVVHAKNLL